MDLLVSTGFTLKAFVGVFVTCTAVPTLTAGELEYPLLAGGVCAFEVFALLLSPPQAATASELKATRRMPNITFRDPIRDICCSCRWELFVIGRRVRYAGSGRACAIPWSDGRVRATGAPRGYSRSLQTRAAHQGDPRTRSNAEHATLLPSRGALEVHQIALSPHGEGKTMIAAYIIKQYERAVVFKLGKVGGPARGPGLIFVVPFAQRIRRVSLRIVTMPIQAQGIITKDNVSIDVSAVAYYRVEDPVRSVLAIENVG